MSPGQPVVDPHDPTSAQYESAVAARWGPRDPTIRSFWQSRAVNAEINRRVTRNPDLTPPEYFVRTYCKTPRERALSIGCGDGGLELRMLRLGACDWMLAIDLSEERLERARSATPPELADRLELASANIETWRPPGQFDLVIANGVVHHLERLEEFFDLLDEVLTDDGLLYLDEFVGPSRFQWTDRQLEIINRLLDRLSPELRRDLVEPELGLRPPCTRPSLARLIAADPSEAARSAEIPELLHKRLHTVEERPWGGAIFHQFFNRIMGNFAGHDDLVRVLMELDAILTETDVVANDFLWGIYRRRLSVARAPTSPEQTDGRLESIEGRTAVGWAASRGDGDRRLPVDMYIDHKLVAKAIADLPRADLAREGIGDGAHAFRIDLPTWVCDGGRHSISIFAPSEDSTIPVARGWEKCNGTVPDRTTFSVARHDPELGLPASRVLDGRNGWTFPCDDAVGSIEQMLGHLTLTDPDIRCYRSLLTRRARLLAELGIPLIVAVIPTKAAVHPDRLRNSSPALAQPTHGRRLLEALAGSDVITVDLYPPLRSAALGGHQVFYKRGSHWNHHGSLIAAQVLLDAVRAADVPAATLTASSGDWMQVSFEGDLSGRPTVILKDGRFEPGPPASGAEVEAAPDAQPLGIRRIDAPAEIRAHDPLASIIEIAPPAAGSRALIFHDPDGGRLQRFVGPAFSRSVWLTSWELDMALLERERPSVVIYVLDEPMLVQVPYGVAG